MTGTINNVGVNVTSLIIEGAFVVLNAQLFIDKDVNIEKFFITFSPGFEISDFPAEDINKPLGIDKIDGFSGDSLAQEIVDLLNREKRLFEGFVKNLGKSQIKTAAYLPLSNYGDKIKKLWKEHRIAIALAEQAFGEEEE